MTAVQSQLLSTIVRLRLIVASMHISAQFVLLKIVCVSVPVMIECNEEFGLISVYKVNLTKKKQCPG